MRSAAPAARARFHIKSLRNAILGVVARPHCQRCANVGRFSATLLLVGFATGSDKTHWHSCARQKPAGNVVFHNSAILVVCRMAWTLQNALYWLREEELSCRSYRKGLSSWEHQLVRSLIHWCTDWLIHWFTYSLIHWLVDCLTHSFIESLVHRPVDSLIHWLLILWFTASLILWLADWLVFCLFSVVVSLIHYFDSLIHSFMSS